MFYFSPLLHMSSLDVEPQFLSSWQPEATFVTSCESQPVTVRLATALISRQDVDDDAAFGAAFKRPRGSVALVAVALLAECGESGPA